MSLLGSALYWSHSRARGGVLLQRPTAAPRSFFCVSARWLGVGGEGAPWELDRAQCGWSLLTPLRSAPRADYAMSKPDILSRLERDEELCSQDDVEPHQTRIRDNQEPPRPRVGDAQEPPPAPAATEQAGEALGAADVPMEVDTGRLGVCQGGREQEEVAILSQEVSQQRWVRTKLSEGLSAALTPVGARISFPRERSVLGQVSPGERNQPSRLEGLAGV